MLWYGVKGVSMHETNFTIGDVAREAGVGVETVRYYERRGLVAQPGCASRVIRMASMITVPTMHEAVHQRKRNQVWSRRSHIDVITIEHADYEGRGGQNSLGVASARVRIR